MKQLMRKIVAGPKKKTPYNGKDLDLTYITDRVIAMAYPASNFFQKAYRNSIEDVASYFNEYHKNNYLIINVSCRPYDYTIFQGRVREYEWPDHQAPPITTLIAIASEIKHYLKKMKDGVVAVHCNHGKGRTGTAIIAFILYMGLYEKAQDALAFYNCRRFQSDNYGVDQPCQTRYLTYIEQIKKIQTIPKHLIAYQLTVVRQKGLHNKYFLNIQKTRTGELLGVYYFDQFSVMQQKPLMSDLFIEIMEETWSGPKRIARINCHPYFLNPNGILNMKQLKKTFKSSEIKLSKNVHINFEICLQFEYFCLCHVEGSEGIECVCHKQRVLQQKYWQKMINQLQEVKSAEEKDIYSYFYYQSSVLEKHVKKEKEAYQRDIQLITHHIAHLQVEKEKDNLKKQQRQCIIKKEVHKLKSSKNDLTSSSSEDQP